ncbi:thaumatin-like protein [Flagelloscypha sp. PMI_526]|nr:thaumatin-like protein [Flagelloscypha sp. PMI_526]
MKYTTAVLFALTCTTSFAAARTFTVKNNCAYTLWPGMFTDPNVGSARPSHETGWQAAPKTAVQFNVPNDWKSGRIWARTGCDFSKGPLACDTGACNGGLQCASSAGTGVPPASLAEWTLNGSGGLDYYDVSLVDGFNVPMRIDNNKQCNIAACVHDLNDGCPAQLQQKNSAGKVVGCKSACAANLDGNPANSANCCSGSHNTPATCPSSGVAFYSHFKKCVNSYVYAYDEGSHTALWTCESHLQADYTLTFCP